MRPAYHYCLLAQAFLHLGQLKQREGDNSGAVYFLSAADYYRGISEVRRGDTNNALVDFSKAIELNPPFDQAYYDRGKLKQTMGDLDGALGDYDKAIELNPQNSAAYNNRGNVRVARNDLDGAFADFRKAVELDPRPSASVIFSSRVRKSSKWLSLLIAIRLLKHDNNQQKAISSE